MIMSYNRKGTSTKPFGNGHWWNARLEKLDTLYKNFDKGCIIVNGFFEGSGYFRNSNSIWLHLATMEDEKSILIITMNSKNTPIEKFHGRTPVILENPKQFINTGEIKLIDYSLLKVAI